MVRHLRAVAMVGYEMQYFQGSKRGVMKAKEYAQLYTQDKTPENLITILHRFINETYDIIERRNAQSDRAAVAVLDEQHHKWVAFSKMVSGVKPEGFALAVCDMMPNVVPFWELGRELWAAERPEVDDE